MAVDDKKQEEERKALKYFYRQCPSCGSKLHIDAFTCFRCGKRYNYNAKSGKWAEEIVVWTNNQNDAIYCRKLNDSDRCIDCLQTQRNRTCFYISCFGTGKGDCKTCEKNHETRFTCCQNILSFYEKLEQDPVQKEKYWNKKNEEMSRSIMPFDKKQEISA